MTLASSPASSTMASTDKGPQTAARARRRTPKPASGAAAKAPTSRAASKPAKAGPTKAVSATKVSKAPKASKIAKPPKVRIKLVRDGFTMPETDFALIGTLKARTLGAAREAKKSELLRAGLHALAALDTKQLVAALNELAPVKTGRPKKSAT